MRIRTYQHPKLADRILGIFCDEDTNRWFVILQIQVSAEGEAEDRLVSVVKELEGLDPTKLRAEPIGYSDAKLIEAITRWDTMMTDPIIQASVIVQEMKNPVVGIDNPDEPDSSMEDDVMGA